MLYYNHREGINPEGKEGRPMTNYRTYADDIFDVMIEEALAEMEAKGEKLPEIRYGEDR
jgi:hypothetical protein